jgi:hypothetical protein
MADDRSIKEKWAAHGASIEIPVEGTRPQIDRPVRECNNSCRMGYLLVE